MGEGIELPEHHHHEEEGPLVVPVSVTISILAVLVAIVTLMGHRAHTEELSKETQAASRWEQYQAKSIRLRMTQVGADIVSVVAPLNKEKGEALAQKYEKEVEHYASDKEDVSKIAEEFEAERDRAIHRADRFDFGEVLLEIGLVICSLTLLAKNKIFWVGGVLVAVIGFGVAMTGFLTH
jgi:ABC-type nickel/cobalt efflux system permease component RcnA